MFNGVPSGSRFRADARFFTGSNTFVGEMVQFFDAANFAPGEWHSFATTAMVPAGASVGDVRFSTFFAPFAGGQVFVDNVQLLRNVPVPGDYNADGSVDAADFVVWRKTLGTQVATGSGADGNRNGQVDADDYAVWRQSFGTSPASPLVATAVMPEPTLNWLLLVTAAVLMRTRAG
jgi:hypothetical protein